MNNLLLKENLDVKLTPYRILAGYCVITYILGVGIAIWRICC
jgi:hypothetical protein